ncbi:Ethanolamine operon regulatory protein [Klebsiella pneumoniae IS22]|nr:Ethanolamine operon regulatory protein [Klebsiella pneumoniae IS22]
MKKTRTANLHHLYHEPLPENLKLTPKVEVIMFINDRQRMSMNML